MVQNVNFDENCSPVGLISSIKPMHNKEEEITLRCITPKFLKNSNKGLKSIWERGEGDITQKLRMKANFSLEKKSR